MWTNVIIQPDTGGAPLTFDGTMREQHNSVSIVTTKPVEIPAGGSGASKATAVADHVQDSTVDLTLELFVSNSPATDETALASGKTQSILTTLPLPEPSFSLVNLLFPKSKDAVLNFAKLPDPDYIRQTHDTLEAFRLLGDTHTVTTASRVYESMVLQSVSLPRDERDGAVFTVKFIRVLTSPVDVTTSTPLPKVQQGKAAVDTGSQTPEPVKASFASAITGIK